jgi:hypothetical protein
MLLMITRLANSKPVREWIAVRGILEPARHRAADVDIRSLLSTADIDDLGVAHAFTEFLSTYPSTAQCDRDIATTTLPENQGRTSSIRAVSSKPAN